MCVCVCERACSCDVMWFAGLGTCEYAHHITFQSSHNRRCTTFISPIFLLLSLAGCCSSLFLAPSLFIVFYSRSFNTATTTTTTRASRIDKTKRKVACVCLCAFVRKKRNSENRISTIRTNAKQVRLNSFFIFLCLFLYFSLSKKTIIHSHVRKLLSPTTAAKRWEITRFKSNARRAATTTTRTTTKTSTHIHTRLRRTKQARRQPPNNNNNNNNTKRTAQEIEQNTRTQHTN